MSARNHHRDLRFYVSDENLDIINMAKLKSLRESINWEIEEERSQLLDKIYPLMDDWKRLPNLREVFRAREINWLLAENLRKNKHSARFVNFLSRRGYRDEPDLDEATGRPLLQGITPLHVAVRLGLLEQLNFSIFRMYSGLSNYVDEHGYSHFHAVCRLPSAGHVQEFLELGQDPNEPVSATGDTPLHLSIQARYLDEPIVRALLRAGADPTLANEEGLTPLHCLCRLKKFTKDDWARKFFELCDELDRPVEVDALDARGWTPLRHAVATLLPDSVDALLNRGADVSGFVFPTEFYPGVYRARKPRIAVPECRDLYRAAGVLAIVERLEKAGYELSRADAMTIVRFFHDYGLFDASEDNERSWYKNDKWAEEAKKIAVRDDNDPSQLSLYDLTRASSREAAKLLAYKDYFDLAVSDRILGAGIIYRPRNIDSVPCRTLRTCAVHLAEKITRGFFESWALEPFMQLIHNRLPMLCCDMILENLSNVDLYNICFAASL